MSRFVYIFFLYISILQIYATNSYGEWSPNSASPSGDQKSCTATLLKDNNLVVGWTKKIDNDNSESSLQLYDHEYKEVGGNILIPKTQNIIKSPILAPHPVSGFIVVYKIQLTASNQNIFARSFQDPASPGAEIQLNHNTDGFQDYISPAITVLPNNLFVVTWYGKHQTGDTSGGIMFTIFDQNINIKADTIAVNTGTTGNQDKSRVTALQNNTFIVVWAKTSVVNQMGILARRFSSVAPFNAIDNQDVLIEADVNARFPDICELENGKIVTVFTMGNTSFDGNNLGVGFKIFDAELNEIKGLTIATTQVQGYQGTPYAIAISKSEFIITWHNYLNSDRNVYMQRYDEFGNKIGDQFQVNSESTNQQWYIRVSKLQDDKILFAYDAQKFVSTDYDCGLKVVKLCNQDSDCGGEYRNQETICDPRNKICVYNCNTHPLMTGRFWERSKCLSNGITSKAQPIIQTYTNLCNQDTLLFELQTSIQLEKADSWTITNSDPNVDVTELNKFVNSKLAPLMAIPRKYFSHQGIYTFNGIKFGINHPLTAASSLPTLQNTQDSTCVCPADPAINPITQKCRDKAFNNPTLDAVELDSNSKCATIKLTFKLAADELSFMEGMEGQITWEVTPTTQYLTEVLSLQKQSYEILISNSNLQQGVSYTFKATSQFGKSATKIFTLGSLNQEGPKFTIENGPTQTLTKYNDNYIRAKFDCEPTSLNSTWSQVGGPTIDVQNYVVSSVPTWLKIPRCILKPENQYKFKFSVTTTQPPKTNFVETTINVQAELFTVFIGGGNIDHPETLDLDLSAVIQSVGGCPIDLSQFSYVWQCKVQNSGTINLIDCPNPGSIFKTTTSNQTLVIPKSILSKDTQIKIYLETRKGSVQVNSETTIYIKESNIVPFQIECLSSPCAKYSPGTQYQFKAKAKISGVNYNKMNYLWHVDPAIPISVFQQSLNLQPQYDTFNRNQITINFKASNLTNLGSASYSMIINTPPQSGAINCAPSEGDALITKFQILAYNWKDDDLFLQYQFSYSETNNKDTSTLLTSLSSSDSVNTILSSNSQSATIYLYVDVYDVYKGKNSANTTVKVKAQNFRNVDQSISSLGESITSISSFSDPQQKIEQLNVVSQYLKNFDTSITPSANKVSQCDCSGNGNCVEKKCICNAGFTLDDCSITQAKFDEIQKLKLDLLTQLDSSLDKVDAEVGREASLNLLSDISANPSLVSKETLTKVQSTFDKIIDQSQSQSKPLTTAESKKATETLNQLIELAAKDDCKAEGKVVEDLKTQMQKYLDTISEGLLINDILVGDDPVIENAKHYTIYLKKTTECQLLQDQIKLDANTPKLQIDSKSLSKDCDKPILLKYYPFNGNIFDCNENQSSEIKKDKMIIQILDDNKDVANNFGVNVNYPESLSHCPNKCTKDEPTKKCKCEELSLFDASSQISNIFANSNLAKALQVQSLLSWEFQKSVGFWFVTGFTILFAVTLVSIKKWIPDYCIMDKLSKTNNPSSKKLFFTALIVRLDQVIQEIRLYSIRFELHIIRLLEFMVVHPLLNVFMVRRTQTSKQDRAILFFARTFMIQVFVAFFGAGAFEILRLLESDEDSFAFNPYMLILPYFTFVPVMAILEAMISLKQKRIANGCPDDKIVKIMKSNRRRKILRKIGFIAIIILSIGCLFTLYTLDSNFKNNDRINFVIGFIQAVAQDWFITPFLFVLIQMGQNDNNISEITLKKHSLDKKKQLNKLKTSGIQSDDTDDNKMTTYSEKGKPPSHSSHLAKIHDSQDFDLTPQNSKIKLIQYDSRVNSINFSNNSSTMLGVSADFRLRFQSKQADSSQRQLIKCLEDDKKISPKKSIHNTEEAFSLSLD